MLEGAVFTIYTDHKPLAHAFHAKPGRHSPREARHLDYITQYTTDIRHIKGTANMAADAMSRMHIDGVQTVDAINLQLIAANQEGDEELATLQKSQSLTFQQMPLPSSAGLNWCDTSTGHERPYIPAKHRRQVFFSATQPSAPRHSRNTEVDNVPFFMDSYQQRHPQVDSKLHPVPESENWSPYQESSRNLPRTRCTF